MALRTKGRLSVDHHVHRKGFRVLPAGWKDLEATKALIEFSRLHANPKLLGHMFTTWGVNKDALMDFPPLVEGLKLLRERRPL